MSHFMLRLFLDWNNKSVNKILIIHKLTHGSKGIKTCMREAKFDSLLLFFSFIVW